MVHLKISDYINNNFPATLKTSDFQFFLTNEIQLSLLKVLHNFNTFRVEEKFDPI